MMIEWPKRAAASEPKQLRNHRPKKATYYTPFLPGGFFTKIWTKLVTSFPHPSLNPAASRSRCADLVDRSELTSEDAQQAGRFRRWGRGRTPLRTAHRWMESQTQFFWSKRQWGNEIPNRQHPQPPVSIEYTNNMWFLWKFTFFLYQYRVNIQIPHKIASISAIIPWTGQKPPPPYRTSLSAHCFSACPALYITAPATDAQRARITWILAPLSSPVRSSRGLLCRVRWRLSEQRLPGANGGWSSKGGAKKIRYAFGLLRVTPQIKMCPP